MKCKRCSRDYGGDQRYCSFCGAEAKTGKRQALVGRADDDRLGGDLGAARANLEKAKALEPDNHYLDLLLGLNHENSWSAKDGAAELEQARKHYSAFLKIDFGSENVHQLYIGTYQKEGRLGEVRRRYAGYLEVEEDNELLARCLKWIDISATINASRPAVSAPVGEGGYRRLRAVANPIVITLVLGAIELTVAGVDFIMMSKGREGSGDLLLHGIIGVVLWAVSGYLFFSRRAD